MALYCDLHAHSRKHNIFVYGCENRRGGDRRLQEQVFPLMLHKNTADKVLVSYMKNFTAESLKQNRLICGIFHFSFPLKAASSVFKKPKRVPEEW